MVQSLSNSLNNLNLKELAVQTQPKISEDKLKALQDFASKQKIVNVVIPKRPDRIGLKSEVILETNLQNEKKKKLQNLSTSNVNNKTSTNMTSVTCKSTTPLQQKVEVVPTSSKKEFISVIQVSSTNNVNTANINQNYLMTTANQAIVSKENIIPKMTIVPNTFNFSQNLKSVPNPATDKPTLKFTTMPSTTPVLFTAKVIQSNNGSNNLLSSDSADSTKWSNTTMALSMKDEKLAHSENIPQSNVSKPQVFAISSSSANIFTNFGVKTSTQAGTSGNETFVFGGSKNVLSFSQTPPSQPTQLMSANPLPADIIKVPVAKTNFNINENNTILATKTESTGSKPVFTGTA